MRPRLLDLFCGAGGAAMGYHRAGFEVVGVDLHPQPHYPFEFHQADAMTFPLEGFDAIHASPPCQRFSILRHTRIQKGMDHPDLVDPVRVRLVDSGVPWVIENVPGAPLYPVLILCGSMFGLGSRGRQLRRHRLFESSHMMYQLQCNHVGEAVGVYGHGGNARYVYQDGVRAGRPGHRGGYQGSAAEKREAMGVDWMNGRELSQAIPPAYTQWIGARLMEALR